MTTARTALTGALTLALVCPGCAFQRLKQDLKVTEGYGRVSGEISVRDWSGAPILMAAGRLPEEGESLMHISAIRTYRAPEEFSMLLEPGRWVIAVVEDGDRSGGLDEGERGVLSRTYTVVAGEHISEIELVVEGVYEPPAALQRYETKLDDAVARGDVVPLEDPRFAAAPAKKGVWQPMQYVLENRPGLYMLEPFDPARTPALFVHGMLGYPQEFSELIAQLDRERFQPWVLLYPSGFPLDRVSSFLHTTLNELELKHSLARVCVVAHSMGGLVSRAALGLHTSDGEAQSVRGLVTIASPLGGMPSAALGVKMAPEVVPSWHDISPGSEFLRELYRHPLPPELEYQLLFAFEDRGDDDGTVIIQSQLRAEAQDEAEVVRGYQTTHEGALRSPEVIAQVKGALDRCRGDAGPRVIARPK